MECVTLYLDRLRSEYGGLVEVKMNGLADVAVETDAASWAGARNLENVPEALHPLYSMLAEASLPFGHVYPLETAVERSHIAPFYPDWFVFGKDNYFSFWLCSHNPDNEGLSFTSWDHGSGVEIGGAVFADVVEFLEDQNEEYKEFEAEDDD